MNAAFVTISDLFLPLLLHEGWTESDLAANATIIHDHYISIHELKD